MTNTKPWHARIALWLAVLLPVFLMACALGTKFGLWGWQPGLTAFGLGGMIWMGITALLALVSIILTARRAPKNGLGSAVFALLVPLAIAGFFAPTFLGAGDHPIHDVSTDTSNPPPVSPELLAARTQADANPINDYAVPLSQTRQFAETAPPLGNRSHAQIIAENYPQLEPLLLADADLNAAVNAIQLAMADMGLTGIRYIPESGTIEGLAETFWFGFKDDVIVRVAETEGGVKVDLRSISRVGRSDLGKNAERIMDLQERIAGRIAGQISAGK